MKATNLKLKEFFVHQLRDIYWAEKKLFKTLPKLQEAATTPELKDAFGQQRHEIQDNQAQLEARRVIDGGDQQQQHQPHR